MKKRIATIVMATVFACLAMTSTAFAATKTIVLTVSSPNMTVDGTTQEIDPARGTTPIVVAGRALVPIRTIIEQMGGSLAWDQSLQLVTVSAAKKTIKVTINSKTAQVKDESVANVWSSKTLDVPAKSINGRTMVPLRFVTETLGATVNYEGSTKTITITFTPIAFDPLNWTGTWTIDTGDITLIQSGVNVSGSNAYWGAVTGTVSGKVLTGKWYLGVTNQGDLEFTISDDGKSFTGKWRYNYPGLDETSKEWSTGQVGIR